MTGEITLSIEDGKDHSIVLRFWVMAGGSTEDVLRYEILPEEMLDFQRRITERVGMSLHAVGQALAWGDCTTCRNTRLVDGEPRAGRTPRISCPDCRADGIPVAFRHYPIAGGGLSPRGVRA